MSNLDYNIFIALGIIDYHSLSSNHKGGGVFPTRRVGNILVGWGADRVGGQIEVFFGIPHPTVDGVLRLVFFGFPHPTLGGELRSVFYPPDGWGTFWSGGEMTVWGSD